MSMTHLTMVMPIELPGPIKSVLMVIAYHANGDDSAYPSVNTIMREAGLARRSVFRALAELEGRSLIVKIRQASKHGTNIYRLHDAVHVNQRATGGCQTDTLKGAHGAPYENPRGAPQAPQGCTTGTKGVHHRHPNQVGTKREEEYPPIPPRGVVRVSPPSLTEATPRPTERPTNTDTPPGLILNGSDGQPLPDRIDRARAIWNQHAGPKRQIRTLNPKRRATLTRRLKDLFDNDMQRWGAFCQAIAASAWLNGGGSGTWFAPFDWCLTEEHAEAILNGSYPPKEPEYQGLRSNL